MEDQHEFKCYYCQSGFDLFQDIYEHIINYHGDLIFKLKRLKFCDQKGLHGYVTVNYNFTPNKVTLQGKVISFKSPDKVFLKDCVPEQTPSPVSFKRNLVSTPVSARCRIQFDSDDIGSHLQNISLDEPVPLVEDKYTNTEETHSVPEMSEILHLLPEVIDNLKQSGLIKEWMGYIRMLGTKTFPLNNIAHLLFLDVCRWYQCDNTLSMRYSPEVKKFWMLGYRLFHGKFLRYMSGMRHIGNVKSGFVEKNQYSPFDTTINFAVPQTPSLTSAAEIKASDIKPGLLHPILDMLSKEEGKTYKICVDGKKLNVSSSQVDGEVNLFGFEDKPTFEDNKRRIYSEKSFIKETDRLISLYQQRDLCSIGDILDIDDRLKQKLEVLIKISSRAIKALRIAKVKKNLALEKFKKLAGSDITNNKYSFIISSIQTILFLLNEEIGLLLKTIDVLCSSLSTLNSCNHLYIGGNEIRLMEQSNYVCLSGIEQLHADISELDFFSLVRQRTDFWYSIRKMALVTGSTLNNAIGLGKLKDQKEHYDEFVLGQQRKEPTDAAKRAMAHGTKNEINAIGTLVGKILPALYPSMSYYEEGCYTLKADNRIFCVISPDGSTYDTSKKKCTFAVEVKCPVPGKTFTTPVYYEVPKYYIPQVLAEMRALQVNTTLFLSYTEESTTAFTITYSEKLWNDIWHEAQTLLGSGTRKPTKLSENSKLLREQIENFKKTNVTFIGEFPSLIARPCSHTSSEDIGQGRYYHRNEMARETHHTLETLRTHVSRLETTIQTVHDMTKPVASEILMFVISDLDRMFHPERPHAFPICYGMKGYSLTTETLRNMIFHLLDECRNRNIHVPVISFDGQWGRLVVRDSNGKPLTRLQLQKDIFEESKSTSKGEIIKYIMNANVLNIPENCQNINELVEMSIGHNGVSLGRKKDGYLVKHTINSLKLFAENETNQMKQNTKDTFIEEQNVDDVVLRTLPEDDVPLDDEILHIIDEVNRSVMTMNSSNVNSSGANSLDVRFDFNEGEEIEEVQDGGKSDVVADVVVPNADHTKKADKCISQMALILQHHSDKRKNMTESELKEFFKNASNMSKLTLEELKMFIKEIGNYLKENKCDIKTWWPKSRIINCLSKAVGDNSEIKSSSSKKRSPKSLRNLCKHVISTKYPKSVLNVIYASSIRPNRVERWNDQKVIEDDVNVTDVEGIQSWFSTPPIEKDQVIFPILDTEHMLVNMRVKCCTSGLPKAGVHKKAWLEVAKRNRENKSGLTLAHVQDVIDKQSCAFALTTFSEEVENSMISLGYSKEATFCRLIREWYQAEDEPGLSQQIRYRRRLALRSWLLENVDFDSFPPPGAHIKDVPIILYEGLLTSIERRIQLFPFVKSGTYNVRSIGSQDVENFFGEFTDLDPKGTGVIRPDDVKTVIADACEIYKARLDPNRSFAMRTSTARPYPVKLPEDMEVEQTSDVYSYISFIDSPDKLRQLRFIQLKDHLFDGFFRRKSNPKRKRGDLQGPGLPARGIQPVRQHHKRDESKILAHKRIGIDL